MSGSSQGTDTIQSLPPPLSWGGGSYTKDLSGAVAEGLAMRGGPALPHRPLSP